jgi:hypothetical protein
MILDRGRRRNAWRDRLERRVERGFIGTTAAIISAIAMGAGAAASVYGAHKQADSATEAAKLSTDAATHAADVQAQSNREALEFQRQQAEAEWQNSEVNRRGNYDQWAAKRRNIGSIGQFLGLGGGGDIPAYVPSVDPRFVAGGAPAAGAPAAGATGGPGGPAPRRPPASTAAPIDPRLLGGNTGRFLSMDMGTPQLQPDGTYAFLPAPPRYRSFGDYLGA